jgi:hypothetical protein
MQWGLDLDDARLPRSTTLDVLLDNVDAFNDYPVSLDEVDPDFTLLALVPARRHQDRISRSNLAHVLVLPAPRTRVTELQGQARRCA